MESDISLKTNSNNYNLVGTTRTAATHATTTISGATTSFINAFATGYEAGYKDGCAVAAGCSVDDITDNICTGIGNIGSIVVSRDHYNFGTGYSAGYSSGYSDSNCSITTDANNDYNSGTTGACLCWNPCCIL